MKKNSSIFCLMIALPILIACDQKEKTVLFIAPSHNQFSSSPSPSPAYELIEFGKIEPTCAAQNAIAKGWEYGLYSFNGAPEIGTLITAIRKKYNIKIAVETGTYLGNSAAFFANLFDTVYTIEIDESIYKKVAPSLKIFPNVQAILGSSSKVLPEILPELSNEFILFYLDAHWGEYWPILDEINAISVTHKNKCVIVIDDVKVPNRPEFGFDSYHGQDLSFEYVKQALSEVFTSYQVIYLLPKDPRHRAKMLIMPKQV
jgi:predicted O-methyltransferase YrrM